MKYINMFKTTSDFLNFKENEMTDDAHVSYVEETGNVNLKPYIIPPAVTGDVAYWDGSKVKTTPLSSWNTSLGTAIGVVVVPEGFAPDGKTRIIGLKPINKDGYQTTSHQVVAWGGHGTFVGPIAYKDVPTTDNTNSTTTGSYTWGYLPSDSFTGETSFVDPKAKYYGNTPYIPSPYLGDSPNPEYHQLQLNAYSNNSLGDFNGLNNTKKLVELSLEYIAANAVWKSTDGSSNLQWYLPAMGELGYVMPRLNEINATITALGGLTVKTAYELWSSTEYSSTYVYGLDPSDGDVSTLRKSTGYYIRPFAVLE